MQKLLYKYLKPFLLIIILMIGLIYAQASADLKLPEIMSNIINQGIQQKGVDGRAPIIIRDSQLNKIKLFLNEDQQKLVIENYQALTVGSDKVDKYPLLASEVLWELKQQDSISFNAMEVVLLKPWILINAFDSQKIPMPLPPGVEIYAFLQQQTLEQRLVILTKMDEKLSELSPSMLRQQSSSMLAKEYEAIGIKLETLQMQFLWNNGLQMLLLALMSITAAVLVGLFATRTAAKVAATLRKDVFSKIMSFANVELDQFSTASLITRSTNDITQIQQLLIIMFRIIFYTPILGGGAILKILNSNSSMTWIIVLGVSILSCVIFLMFKFVIPKFKLNQKLIDKVNLVARENLTGLMVIRAFNNEQHEAQRFDQTNKELTGVTLYINRAIAFLMPTMNFILSSLMVLIVWFGAKQVDLGQLQVGDMMAFMQYSMQILMSFLMMSMVFIMLPRAAVSADRIMEVLDMPVSIKDPEIIQDPTSVDADIVFDHVSFTYPNADEPALSDISFVAKAHQTTAIIGSTGCGKTTLVNLMLRLYDPQQGTIKIKDQPLQQYSLKKLRDLIGYVPQKSALFSGTIETNLKYGNQQVSDEQLDNIIEIAQAKAIIEEKPEGQASSISQGGSNVSGGQRQRLSIARALVKNSEIYIFDDSFSALDYQTDAKLRQALHTKLADKTFIIVAQRIATIRHADQILVMNNGMIVGRGNHQTLLATCDVYREIASSQLSPEELNHE